MALAVGSRAVLRALAQPGPGRHHGVGLAGCAAVGAARPGADRRASAGGPGVLGFLVLALGMLPAAWIAGRVDRLPLPVASAERRTNRPAPPCGARSAAAFMVMTAAYFVCGMQLPVHRHPSAVLSRDLRHGPDAQRSGAGGDRRCSTCSADCSSAGPADAGPSSAFWAASTSRRSIVLGWYFLLPPTPFSTLVFAARMGFCGWASGRWWRARWPRCSACAGRR